MGLEPITAANAALGVSGFMKAALGVRFFAGAFLAAGFLAAAFLAGAFLAGAFYTHSISLMKRPPKNPEATQ